MPIMVLSQPIVPKCHNTCISGVKYRALSKYSIKLTTLRVVLKRECLAHNAQDCLWQSLASKSTKNVLIQAYNACYCKKALFYKLSGGMAHTPVFQVYYALVIGQ